MRLYRRPWTWFFRFRHRRGYGVHSPFAFAFLTGVVYEHGAYYAYQELARLHPWWVRWGHLYPLTCRRLLFRLVNYVHPQAIMLVGDAPLERTYMAAAVPSARWVAPGHAAELIMVKHECLATAPELLPLLPPDGMMVIEGIHADKASRTLWQQLQEDEHTGMTFDLYTYGILFFNKKFHKQHYLINF